MPELLLGEWTIIQQGKLIVFAGVDGTGKSTLANAVKTDLEMKNMPVEYIWMRMNYFLSRPFLLFCRLTGLTKRPVVNGRKISIHEFYRFKPVAKLIQYTHFMDTVISWFKHIYVPLNFQKKFVICDRFVHDILIDCAVEGHEWDIFSKRISRLFCLLIPKNAKLFLIEVEKDKILKRKTNVKDFDKYFDQRFRLYDELKKDQSFTIINNNASMDLALNKILKKLNLN